MRSANEIGRLEDGSPEFILHRARGKGWYAMHCTLQRPILNLHGETHYWSTRADARAELRKACRRGAE